MNRASWRSRPVSDVHVGWTPYTSTFIDYFSVPHSRESQAGGLRDYALTLQTERGRVELEIAQEGVRTVSGRIAVRVSWTVVNRKGVQLRRPIAPTRVLSDRTVTLEGLPLHVSLPSCVSLRELEIVAFALGRSWDQLDSPASAHWVQALFSLDAGTFRNYTVAEMLADLAENHESNPD